MMPLSVLMVLRRAIGIVAVAGRFAALVAVAWSPAAAQDVPAETGLEEKVEIHLIQVEVTAWPKGDPASCHDLGPDDFELTVRGRPRAIQAVDRLEETALSTAGPDGKVSTPSGRPAMSTVLYFDLWHLDLFGRVWSACPMTKLLAFEQARRMVRKQFLPGDRLLLVTFAGWPVVHEGWIVDIDHALAALERLELSPAVVSVQRQHSHHQAWVNGMSSLMLALGRYPGHKQILYLGDDFRFDSVAVRAFELAARAQSNDVTVHTIDMVASCRKVPGHPCLENQMIGPGCTEFRTPLALAPMASQTGGRLFESDDIARAVQHIREVSGCRFLVSFAASRGETRNKTPRFRIRLKRKGFDLRAPVSFQNPDRPPREREELDALFLLPQFGRGLVAEAGLWPLRPESNKKKKARAPAKQRWRALLLAKLRRSPGEAWDDEVDEIVVDAAVFKDSKTYGHFQKVLRADDLAALKDTGESRLMVFPVGGVRPGDATVVVRAEARGSEMAANLRTLYPVPVPPGPGEARPWFLSDGMARIGDALTLKPSLDGLVSAGGAVTILGYGCRADPPQTLSPGSLTPLDGDRPAVLLRIDWMETPSGDGDRDAAACGWLVGHTEDPLDPGVWRFDPPAGLDPSEEGPDREVIFRVQPPPG